MDRESKNRPEIRIDGCLTSRIVNSDVNQYKMGSLAAFVTNVRGAIQNEDGARGNCFEVRTQQIGS